MRTILNVIIVIVSLCLFTACDPDDDKRNQLFAYDVSIKNESDASLAFTGYRTKDLITGKHLSQPLIIHSLEIAGNTNDQVKRFILPYKIENAPFIYPGFENVIDSIVVKFNSTNRGYIAKVINGNTIVTDKWIANKSPLFNVEFQDLEKLDNIFYYKISQQDYENAPEL